MAQKRAYLEAVVRGLAAAVAPLNAIATTLAPQLSTRLLQLVICKLSPPPLGLSCKSRPAAGGCRAEGPGS
jgi:hypothetical protein